MPLTLIEFQLLKGDYARNEAGEQFFVHREWRLSPDRVVAVYIRQDHGGDLYLRRSGLVGRGNDGGVGAALEELVVGVAADDGDLALLLQLPHLLRDPQLHLFYLA